jgi:hypothetical protein
VRFMALLSLTCLVALNAVGAETSNMTPDALVQRGIESYRSGKMTDAATDLEAAAQGFLSQEQMQNYVNTGTFPNLDRLETALIYLTLAQSKLGHDDQAREAILRLVTAERIQPTYAQLSLPPEAASFESVAARLVPNVSLRANTQVAQGGAATTPATPTPTSTPTATPTTANAPPVQTAQTTTSGGRAILPVPAQTKSQTATSRGAATPPVQTEAKAPVVATPAPPSTVTTPSAESSSAAERAVRQRITDDLVAQECAKMQKAADDRIAQIQRDADARVEQAQRDAQVQIAVLQAENRNNYLLSLRQADAMAASGKTEQANDIYNAIVNSPDVAREIVAEAAIGLYRTGAFRNAANAFAKLAPYKHGEEDLRYYNAVALYETGRFDDAKRELACALPYLEVTEDVSRYRDKIEQTSGQASK